MATSKVTLKLLIDKKQQRVLFAEAGKDFIDFLFSLLVLPVGTVIRLLGDRDIVGGLAKLYKSVSDLNNDYIQPNQNKDVLLKPKSSAPFSSPKLPLLPNEAFSSSTTSPTPDSASSLYKCQHCNILSTYPRTCPVSHCNRTMSFSPAPGSSTSLYKCESKSCNMRSTTFRMCPSCPNKYISAADGFVLKPAADAKPVVGFVKGLVTYMVMDDLAVSPMSTISNITLLNKFNIKDLGDLEEKVVDMGMNEV
ncbi:hypothetical protein HanXRQr2_Chr12g0542051 [Helianthus annuus]|uniref:DUF674 domain-containing protein n=1 Tax=Helianthus annuus TaxID=4232 RepID=A0A9K3HGL7_HELAN|nr:hypothetical protein HanXRQr2_Chr12g0542051 [Helianthus annuus]KAJ0505321.1 hypothetical protein HanHA89_Chr12g0469271 [Helianthus annuus]KAJ0674998.1 hypothetical protein HanLR1_Chr12g0446281 [Helianthus annuus]KAJ0862737.1 hypothetical protein HanPSC8_Chr12g0521811 [Helianthus annuus]